VLGLLQYRNSNKPKQPENIQQRTVEHRIKLDNMRWFSYRRSPSPPGGTQWYRLLLRAACCALRTA